MSTKNIPSIIIITILEMLFARNFYFKERDASGECVLRYLVPKHITCNDEISSNWGKISAQPPTFIMHTVLCLKKTIAVTIVRICNLLALEKVYFFLSPY